MQKRQKLDKSCSGRANEAARLQQLLSQDLE